MNKDPSRCSLITNHYQDVDVITSRVTGANLYRPCFRIVIISNLPEGFIILKFTAFICSSVFIIGINSTSYTTSLKEII